MAQGSLPQGISLQYRQDFNQHFWNARLRYSPIGPSIDGWSGEGLRLSGDFQSHLLEVPGQEKKWKDIHNFRCELLRKLGSDWRISTQLRAFLYLDRQTGFQDQTDTELWATRLEFRPHQSVLFSILGGWKWDRRYRKRDSGWSYQVATSSRVPFLWQGYSNQWQISWGEDQFQQRRNADLQLAYRVRKYFAPGTVDSLSLHIFRTRRDYYISETGDLESRTERGHAFQNRLSYQMGRGLSISLGTSLYQKRMKVSQWIEGQSMGHRERVDEGLEHTLRLSYKRPAIWASLGAEYESHFQNFHFSEKLQATPFIGSLAIPDNTSKRFSLRGNLGGRISPADTLFLIGYISRFQYDTPDTTNFDDRDELRAQIVLGGIFRPFSNWRIQAGLSANLFHLVYIYGNRSADNNWNRIFRFHVNCRYQPSPWLNWHQHAEVLANYTDYDFEEIFSQIRSFVFREFVLCDSLQLKLTSRLRFDVRYRLELEESGYLFWKTFSEERLLSRQIHHYQIAIKYEMGPILNLIGGIQGYWRREWRFEWTPEGYQEKYHWGDFQSFGPLIQVVYSPDLQRRILLSGTNLRVQDHSGRVYHIRQVELTLNWAL